MLLSIFYYVSVNGDIQMYYSMLVFFRTTREKAGLTDERIKFKNNVKKN